MKFYLCSTKQGQRLAGTQVDAKALDPNFETVEWATDKDALMARFNDLFAQLHAASNETFAEASEYAEADEPQEPVEAPPSAKKRKEASVGLEWHNAPEEGSCKRCVAMSGAARSIEGIMALTNIEHAIQMGDKPFLRRIDDALEARAAELQEA